MFCSTADKRFNQLTSGSLDCVRSTTATRIIAKTTVMIVSEKSPASASFWRHRIRAFRKIAKGMVITIHV